MNRAVRSLVVRWLVPKRHQLASILYCIVSICSDARTWRLLHHPLDGRWQVLVECIAGYCPCGDQCANQRLQRGTMPLVSIEECGPKGLGLFARQDIHAGEFVGEYMGEIVTEKEYHMRRLVRFGWGCQLHIVEIAGLFVCCSYCTLCD